MSKSALAQGQHASNRNVWRAHGEIKHAIRQLRHDRRDYGGHRVKALDDLQAVDTELVHAEEFIPRQPLSWNPGGPDSMPGQRGRFRSDRNIRDVQVMLEQALLELNGDAWNYRGHKVGATRSLQSAIRELSQAERFAHGYTY